jgi:hypothetical protein
MSHIIGRHQLPADGSTIAPSQAGCTIHRTSKPRCVSMLPFSPRASVRAHLPQQPKRTAAAAEYRPAHAAQTCSRKPLAQAAREATRRLRVFKRALAEAPGTLAEAPGPTATRLP